MIHETLDPLDTLGFEGIKRIKGFKIIKGSKGISTMGTSACRAERHRADVPAGEARAAIVAGAISHRLPELAHQHTVRL